MDIDVEGKENEEMTAKIKQIPLSDSTATNVAYCMRMVICPNME